MMARYRGAGQGSTHAGGPTFGLNVGPIRAARRADRKSAQGSITCRGRSRTAILPRTGFYSLAGKTPGHEGTYACLLHSGSTLALAKRRRYRPDSIGHIVLAGTIVAFTDSTHRVDTGSTSIVVVNVAARRILLTIPGVGGFIDACIISFRDVTDLVVTDRGAVAWIVRKGVNCRTTTFEVHSAHASGAQSLLEEGPAIVPGSLRVSGQAASWESGGQRRSASLA
jgi:hypothetical protein